MTFATPTTGKMPTSGAVYMRRFSSLLEEFTKEALNSGIDFSDAELRHIVT